MIIAPLQSFGLGDVIFCQTLAQDWIKEGHTVVWGVEPHYVEGLNRAYPDVKFVDYRTLPINYNAQHEHDSEGYRVLPLRWSVELCKVPYCRCMESKYLLFQQDFSRWRENAMWQRDRQKEEELLHLVNPEGGKYCLINETYQTDMQGKISITGIGKYKKIHLRTIEGYSLFDWALVIQKAMEIHTVSTSLFYLLEMLDTRGTVHLYPRLGDPKFTHIDYLFTKKYICHPF